MFLSACLLSILISFSAIHIDLIFRFKFFHLLILLFLHGSLGKNAEKQV